MSCPWINQLMVYGWGCDTIDNFNLLMTLTEIKFFWLLLLIVKCSGVPFPHICEWNRFSPSLGSHDFFVRFLWSNGSTRFYIYDPISFISFWIRIWARLFFQAHPTMILSSDIHKCCVYGFFLDSHHFLVSFNFPLPLFSPDLGWISWGWTSLIYPLFCELGLPFLGFCCNGYVDPNSWLLFCFKFFSILISYR